MIGGLVIHDEETYGVSYGVVWYVIGLYGQMIGSVV